MSCAYISDSFNCWIFIVFIARINLVSLCWANLTVPNLPLPNFFPRLKSVIFNPCFLLLLGYGLLYREVAGGTLTFSLLNSKLLPFLLVVELTPGITIFEKSKVVRIDDTLGSLKAVLFGLFRLITLLVNPVFFFLFVHWFSLFLIATVVNPFLIFIYFNWLIKLLA